MHHDPPSAAESPALHRLAMPMIVLTAGAGLLWRGWHCFQNPVNTGDLVRHIFQGMAVQRLGLESAGHPLVAFDPVLGGVTWGHFPYNYPAVALYFFTLLAAIHPSVLCVKVALTLVEGVNALLVSRITASRLLGLIYWMNPLSIWWVSREGQFEPLQNLFVLLALYVLPRSAWVAAVFLALGVQVKMTALLMVPWFAWQLRDKPMRDQLAAGAAFMAAFLPTLIAQWHYPAVQQLLSHSTLVVYNPYYWNPLHEKFFLWNPTWMIVWHALVAYGLTAAAIYGVYTQRHLMPWLAPLALLIVLRLHSNVQFWYWIALFPMLLPIADRRWLVGLFLALYVIDVNAPGQLLLGPFGYMADPETYPASVTMRFPHRFFEGGLPEAEP